MNKRGIIKLGAGILILLLFSILILSLFFSSAETQNNYSLGDEVKLDFSKYSPCMIKIRTPSGTEIQEDCANKFSLKFAEAGEYTLNMKSENYSERLEFQVNPNIENYTLFDFKSNNNYLLWSTLKFDFNKLGNYEIIITPPSGKRISRVGSNDWFFLDLTEEGQYNLSFERGNGKTFYHFNVFKANPFPPNINLEGFMQGRAEISKPVEWSKTIDTNSLFNSTIGGNLIEITSILSNSSNISNINLTLIKETGELINYSLVNVEGKDYIQVNENLSNDSIKLQYITEPPKVEENSLSQNQKEITISSPQDVHYENILAYTNLPRETSDKNLIKVYWKEQNTYLDFQAYDKNGNGLFDYIEWTVPHLSNQTFEIIIITKAVHLSSNKTFISDIYEQVKALDDIWSETIPDGDYVRVTFQTPLDNTRDITLYPRILSGNPVIDVYEKDSLDLISEFNPLINNTYNRIYLTNLTQEQDTFDLKIVGGSVEFDYIVDPQTIYTVNSSKDTVWGQPPSSDRWNAGTNATNSQYANMATENAIYATVTPTSNNDFPIWRFNFSINEATPLISSIYIRFTGYGNGTSGNDAATLYVWRFTNSTWMPIGDLGTSNANLTRNITSGISDYLDSNHHLVVVVEGANYDTGDFVLVDYLGVTVQYVPDTTPPTYNSVSVNNTLAGQITKFAINVSDNIALNPNGQYIFSTNNSNGVWTNDTAVNFTTTPSWANITKTLNSTVGTRVGYRWFFNDSAGNTNSTPIYVLTTTDGTPPYFTTIPANASLYYANQSLLVTFTGGDAFGFGYYSINDTRFSINQTGFLSNATPMAAGNYEINVTINDTSNNINWTRYKVQINKSNYFDCGIYFNATSPITFPANFITYTNCTTTYTLYRNGTSISNASTINSGAGYYNLTVQRTDTANYTNAVSSSFFTVNKASDSCSVYFNATSPLTYPNFFIAYTNCTTAYALTRNGTAISNATTINSGATAYNISVQRTDAVNYTNTVNAQQFIISKSQEKFNVLFNATSPLTYPDIFIVYANSTSVFTLRRNGTSISNNSEQINGAGYFNFSAQRTDTANYTFNYNSSFFTINKAVDSCSVYFNATSPITFPDNFITYTNCTTAYTLYRNGTSISNASTINSGAGYYNLTVQRTDTANYTNAVSSSFFTVNKASDSCSVYFNATSPLTHPDFFIAYTNCTTAYTLRRNGTAISNGTAINSGATAYNLSVQRTDAINYTNIFHQQQFIINKNPENCQVLFNETSPIDYPATFLAWANCTTPFVLARNGTTISNYSEQALPGSAYNFSMRRNDTINYSIIFNQSQFIVLAETIPPYFTTIPANASLWYGNESLSAEFAAADNIGFGYYRINDTRFSITSYANGTGILKNATHLAAGNYEINVTINDTSNNINWTRYKVQINKSTYYDCGVYFNATSPINYPATFRVYTNCSTAYTLYRNGTAITNNSVINSGAGYYNLTVRRTDTINYTNIFDSEFFTVDKSQENCQVLFSRTSPLNYPQLFRVWANCTTTFTLSRNATTNSTIANNSEQALEPGIYNFSFLRANTANYSIYYNETSFTVLPFSDESIASYNVSSSMDTVWGQPGSSQRWSTGTNASGANYTNMSIDNGEYANIGPLTSDDEPFWRFNFTINEPSQSINWLYIHFSGYTNTNGERATLFVWNYSSAVWINIGVVSPNIDGNVSINYTTKATANTLLDSNNRLTLVVQGSNMDPGEYIHVDYVRVLVGHTPDYTPPVYNKVSINNTLAGQITKFSINASDNLALNPHGGYIFSTNNTGTWQNDSFVLFTTTPSWANVTKILNSTTGTIVGYMWYFNDTSGNTNSTSIYTLEAVADTFPPLISIAYPGNGTYDTAVSTLNYTCSDINPGYCWYSTNNGITNSTPVAAGTNFTGITADFGSNTWIVYCNDSGNYQNNSRVTFFQDEIKPFKSITIEDVTTNTNSGTSLAITRPTNARNGDVLVAYLSKDDNNAITGPAGWTQINQTNTGSSNPFSSGAWYRIITNISAEPASYSWTGDNEQWSGGIMVLRGVNLTNVLDAIPVISTGTDNNATTPSITTITDLSLILSCASLSYGSETITSSTEPAGTTPQIQSYIQEATSLCANYTQSPAGATGTKQWTTDGNIGSRFHAYQIAFRPGKNTRPTGQPMINSTNGRNETDSDLNCYALINDSNYDLINASIRWYKNQALNLSIDYNNSYYPGTNFTSILKNTNLTVWDNWSCSIRLYDGQQITNWTNSTNLMIKPDLTPPTINVTYPLNNQIYTINVSQLNYTAYDFNGVSYCWYSTNNGTTNSTLTSPNNNFTGVISVENVNTWRVYCNDTMGNIGYNLSIFTKDTISPNATLLLPENDSTKGLTNNFTANVTDNVNLKNATLFIFNSTGFLVNQTTRIISGVTTVVGVVVTLADGIYKWFYKIFDNAGNYYNTENNTVHIISAVPNVSITYPLNNHLYTVEISELDYTYYNAYPPGYCWYSNNSGATNSTLVNGGDNFTGVISIEGSNTWTVYCNNSAGNINSSTVTFIKDLLPTQINFINYTPPDQSITGYTNVSINISIFEASLLEARYSWNETNYTFYNGSLILMMNLDRNSAFGESAVSNLTHDSSIYSNDGLCQNMGAGCSWATGKYGMGLSFDGSAGGGNDVVNITAGDIIGTGDDSMCAWIYPTGWGESNAGRIIDTGTTRFTVSNSNTGIRFSSNGGTNYTDSTVSINLNQWSHVCASRYSNGTVNLYINGTLVGTGNSGPVSSGGTNVYIGNRQGLDRTFAGSIDEVRIWNRTISASEAYEMYVSNLQQYDSAQWYLYINQSKNSTTGLDDGNYTYQSTAKDIFGTETSTERRLITIHTAAPLVNITYPLNNTIYLLNVSELNYNYSDPYTGYCWYSKNNGTTNLSVVSAGNNFTGVVSVEGTNFWTVYCNDSAGNVNSSRINFIKNTLAPSINITYPQNISYKVNVSSFNYTVIDASGLDKCWFTNNSGATNSTLVNAGTNFTDLISIEGPNTWKVYCNDTSNYENSSTVSFFKDTDAPVFTNISITNKSGITGGVVEIGDNLTINATVFDSLGLDKVFSVIWQDIIGGSTVIWQGFLNFVNGNSWSTPTSTNLTTPLGLVNYTVYANDTGGNLVNLSSNFTTTDTTSPIVNLTSPANGDFAGINESIQYFLGNFSDNYRLQNSTFYLWNSSDILVNQTTRNISGIINSTNLTVNLTSPGIYYWNYFVCDYAGNCNWNSTNYTLIYYTFIPQVAIVYPINLQNYTINVSQLNYTYNDSNPGYCWYSKNNGTTNLSVISAGTNFTNVFSTEGTNYWTVYCNNSAGNINSSRINFYKDTIVPQINITYPLNTSYNFNITTLNYTYSDASPSQCWYSNDSGITNSTLVSAGNNFTSLFVSEGQNNWTVYCNDSLGNFNLTNVRFTIDLTLPNATILLPQNDTINKTTTQNMTVNLTDNINLKNATLFIFNSTGDKINETTRNVTGIQATVGIVYQFLYDGIFKWFYRVFDLSGNSFSTENNTITIDATKPILNITYPQMNILYTENISTLNYTYLDLHPDSCWYSNSSGTWNSTKVSAGTNFTDVMTKEGVNNFTIYCNDTAGNVNSSTINFTRDLFYPLVNITYPLNVTYSSNVSTLNYSYFDANPGYCWYSKDNGVTNSSLVSAGNNFTGILSAEGQNNWTLYCNDSSGKINVSQRIFFKDSVYPLIQFELPTEINNSNLSQNWIYVNVSVDELNEVNISFNLYNLSGAVNLTALGPGNRSFNWTSLSDAIYFYNVTIFDVASNKNSTETRRILLDTHNPNATLLNPPNNNYTSNATVNLTVNLTDNLMLSNATLYIYNSTDNLINQTTVNVTGIQATVGIIYQFLYDGIFKWFYKVFDLSGNSFSANNNTLTIDTVAPQISITYPINTNYTINVSSINYTYFDVNPGYCWYSKNNGTTNLSVVNAGANFTNVFSTEGTNYWTVYCNDSSGKVNSSQIIFFKDSIKPLMNVYFPLNTTYNINVSQLNYTYLDANPGYCWYSNDSGTTNSTLVNAGTNFTNLISIEGSNTWTIYCNDTFGNENLSRTTFFKDTIFPLIQFGQGTSDNNTVAYQNWIYVNVSVDELNEANVTFTLYNTTNGLTLTNSTTRTNKVRTINWTNLNPGVYYYNVTVIDIANNQNTTETRMFTYGVPDFFINSSEIYFNESSFKENQSVEITATVHNLGSVDINNVTIRFYNGDPDSGGVKIGSDMFTNLSNLSQVNLTKTWVAQIGSSSIFVVVDPPTSTNGSIIELNESNNKASKSITVGSWQFFYGDVLSFSNFVLMDNGSGNLINWSTDESNSGNIYVTDYDSYISWNQLQSIGKKKSSGDSSSDFVEIDTLLNSTNYPDSVYSIYTDLGVPKYKSNIYSFNKFLQEVPIINSTNNSNFVTGILWDTSDDTNGTNGEFDLADKEDLVFISPINKQAQGTYGIYDYEIRVPAKLRQYRTSDTKSAAFYVELS
jgi:hypothetical protein